jgi:hypothetical protein
MTWIEHKVTLTSEHPFGRRLPSRVVGRFLAELPRVVRCAVSMAIRSRSTQKGTHPAWLDRASDIRLVGLEGNSECTVTFEALSLGEAADEFYTRDDSCSALPRMEDTGFDLLGSVLEDLEAANADSDRFDRPLLVKLLRLREVFRRAFSSAHFSSHRPRVGLEARLNLRVLQIAERFLAETPAARRVRVAGKLNSVLAATQTFTLTLDGEEVRGVLVDGDIEELVRLLNSEVLTFGRAVFRPSGRLLRIDVDAFRRAEEADQFFARVPRPLGGPQPRSTAGERERMAAGLRAVIGKWPGDETDEQIRAALEELS